MNDTLPSTSYTSRVLHHPTSIVRSVFDACQWPSISADGAVLELRHDGSDDALAWPETVFTPVRVYPGRLRIGRRFRLAIPVELELLRWSSSATEIGLRVVSRRRRLAERYLEAAAAVMDSLMADLELQCLLATHPAHAAGADPLPRQEVTTSAWL